jgi:hypothetical protein
MVNWKGIIKDYWLRRGDGSELVFGTGATVHDLRNLEKAWDISLPTEFVSLYERTSGVYVNGSNWWLFMPTKMLPNELRLTADWFPDQCREFALQHFRPFIRVYPDRLGYVIDHSGVVNPDLWYFATADITDGASCNPTEHDYLSVYSPGIEQFLST